MMDGGGATMMRGPKKQAKRKEWRKKTGRSLGESSEGEQSGDLGGLQKMLWTQL